MLQLNFPSRDAAAAGARPDRWRLPMAAALAWAFGIAVALSLQFLTQAWVWANWPVTDVVFAWGRVLRDRVVVAVTIALLVWAVSRLPLDSLLLRAGLLALAIVFGALAGELGLRLADDTPHAAIGGVATRWSLVSLAIAGMFYLWRDSVEVRSRWQTETLAHLLGQQQLANAQLAALKHQIEPHFLFNTLATLRQLHRTEPEAGALMLANFIDYLRRAMPMLDSPQVPLTQELTLLRAYLALIAVRMSGRLRTEIDVPEALHQQPVPPLVLATLVENAIQHGLSPAPAGGLLRISGRVLGSCVELAVEDTGVGFGAGGSGGSGIGLANARARLRSLHGAAASLRLEGVQPHGVRAVVTLPANLGWAR